MTVHLPVLSPRPSRHRTVTLDRLAQRTLDEDAYRYPAREHPHPGAGRPRTWGECQAAHLGTPGHPCPWVSCTHHLELDVTSTPSGGESLKSRRERDDLADVWDVIPEEFDHTCVLSFVEAHPDGSTLEEVAEVYDLSRERARQIEVSALARIKPLLLAAGVTAEEFESMLAASTADNREAHCGTARAPDLRDLRAVRFTQPAPAARVVWRAPRPADPSLAGDEGYRAIVARNTRALDPRPTLLRGVVSCGPALPSHTPRWGDAPEDTGPTSQHPADVADDDLTAQETAR